MTSATLLSQKNQNQGLESDALANKDRGEHQVIAARLQRAKTEDFKGKISQEKKKKTERLCDEHLGKVRISDICWKI